jgi:type IX secretion system PorP/SprF family membrane protein
MKKITLLLIFIFSATLAHTQQEAQVSHNMYNHLDVNPGYAGLSGSNCATLIARQQWIGFKDPQGNKGFPQTYLLSIDRPVNFLRGGIGLTIMNDQLGFEKNIGLELSYSRHWVLFKGELGVGAQIGFFNKKIDFTKFISTDPDDPFLVNGEWNEGNTVADFAVGVFYNSPKNMYFGVSSTQLRMAEFNLPHAIVTPTHARHFYVEAGKYIQFNRSFELAPSIFIKTDFASAQFDLNSILKFNNQFWGGLSWRTTDAVAVLVGMTVLGGLDVGYSYDITTSAIGANGRSSGSHEIMLHYCLKIDNHPIFGSYQNVRFLSPPNRK